MCLRVSLYYIRIIVKAVLILSKRHFCTIVIIFVAISTKGTINCRFSNRARSLRRYIHHARSRLLATFVSRSFGAHRRRGIASLRFSSRFRAPEARRDDERECVALSGVPRKVVSVGTVLINIIINTRDRAIAVAARFVTSRFARGVRIAEGSRFRRSRYDR